ncbi:MAG: hypothetical protein ABL932_25910, partial [Terricaulis sp.]
VCHYFVRDALQQACKEISAELDLEESERPEVDHDTKDVPGSPEIVTTILRKIEAAQAFVADLTPVAKTDAGKTCANPNVMIELGYAKHALSADRVVMVANSHWFKSFADDLPFDLRHRRGPVLYELAPGTGGDARKIAFKGLVSGLKARLAPLLKQETAKASEPEFLEATSRDKDPSVWFAKGTKLRHRDFFGDGGTQELVALEAPRSFVRIVPAGWTKGRPLRSALQSPPAGVEFTTLGIAHQGDGGLNAEGLLRYGFANSDIHGRVAHTATQFFVETGEMWSFDARVTMDDDNRTFLTTIKIIREWAKFIDTGLDTLAAYNAQKPFKITVGVRGLGKALWPDRMVRTEAV